MSTTITKLQFYIIVLNYGHVEKTLVDSIVRRVYQIEKSQTTRDRKRHRKTIRETIKENLDINKLNRNMICK